jgi:hypothetical protein
MLGSPSRGCRVETPTEVGGRRPIAGAVALGEVREHGLAVGPIDVAAVLELGPHVGDSCPQAADHAQTTTVLERIHDVLVGLEVSELGAQERRDLIVPSTISATAASCTAA